MEKKVTAGKSNEVAIDEKVGELLNTEVQAKKPRNDSFSYGLKSFKGLIEKIEKNDWATKEEMEALKGVYKKMVERFIGLEMF